MLESRRALLILKKGDITRERVDVVVNAANNSLLGGGGVDGAIHNAGGSRILEECKKIRTNEGGCKTGQAVFTVAGNLPAKYVVHTVGPVWSGGNTGEAKLLHNCYVNSLKLAEQLKARTVAFPSISTGAYGYPVDEASLVALRALREYLVSAQILREVYMVLFSEDDFQAYMSALQQLQKESDGH